MRRLAAAAGVAVLATASHAGDLFGVTATDLVRFDSADPSNVTVIGPHGLDLPSDLAYDNAQRRLFGLSYTTGTPAEQFLVEYDLATGAATILHDLGNTGVIGWYEAFDYVDSAGTLVVSRDPNPGGALTRHLLSLSSDDGTTQFLADNGRDNDDAGYDPVNDVLFVIDPNGVGQLTRVDLTSGANADLANVTPNYGGDMAFDRDLGALLYLDAGDNTLYRWDTNAGAAPVTETVLGVVGGDPINGVAWVDTCPADITGEGDLNTNDFFAFLTLYQGADPAADFFADGFINTNDFFAYLAAYQAGCL